MPKKAKQKKKPQQHKKPKTPTDALRPQFLTHIVVKGRTP